MARYNEREDYDLLNQYLHEIAQIPRLTPERERELGYRVQQNDKSALEELVKANLRFVVSYAKRYRNTHVLFLDLINEGNIGLIHAAKKYDPDKNVKFITYAVWWIRQSILHALSEQGGAFRLPPKRANLMYRLEKAIGSAITEGSQMPTPQELADELGVSLKEVQTLMRANSDNFSLNAELDDESHTELADVIEQTTIPSAEDEMQEESRREELLAHMSELAPLLLYTNPNPKSILHFWLELGDLGESMSPDIDPDRVPWLESLKQQGLVQKTVDELTLQEKTILKLRYGVLQDDELTLRDIGEILGLSRERVRQIESRAEAKCRRSVRR